MFKRLRQQCRTFWQGLLTLTGDDAYQRYLSYCRHRQQMHGDDPQWPMSRREFYIHEQQRKWNRPNRCC